MPVPPRPPVNEPPIGKPEALLVVGDGDNTQNTGDEVLENLLFDNLDLFVTVADDADDSAQFGQDLGVVVISSSANAAQLQDEFLNSRFPVIVMDDGAMEEMQMVEENDSDEENEQEIEIEEQNHPIVANLGLSEDEVEVYNDDNDMLVAEPANDGEIIATVGGDDSVIGCYEAGSELAEDDDNNTRTARNRRCWFFATEPALNDDDLNATGEQLLENAVTYTWKKAVQ
jgi:hypothetical protein